MKPKTKGSLLVGVAGLGFMGENHVRIVSSMRGVRLAGVFDLDQARCEVVAIKFNTRSFPDFQSLLNCVDVVVIASPTSTHYALSIQAMNAKKHVFVEKPLASRAEEGEKMLAASKDKGVVMSCGLIERFNPAFTVAEYLAGKDKPLIINIKRESPLPERITDASVIFDMMIHDIDLALFLAGSQPKEFKAKGKAVKTKMLDRAQASIFFKNGIIANIEANRVAKEKLRTVSIMCERSTIEADLLKKAVKQRFMSDPNAPTLEPPKEVEYPVAPADQITLELKDFFAAIKKGRDPFVTGRDALEALRLAENIEKDILGK
jgi:virulence factor